MEFKKVNLNIGFNPFSQNSVFHNKSLENLQAKTEYFKQEPKNFDEIVIWKENYFGNTQNINEPRGPKYKCNECHEIFNTRLSFLTHSKVHRKPLCILCGKYYTTDKEMFTHMKSLHQKLIRCERIQTNENSTQNCILTESYLNEQLLNDNNNNNNGQRIPSARKVGRPRKYMKNNNSNNNNNNQQTYESIEKQPKQTITSRSGRCITMKVLDY